MQKTKVIVSSLGRVQRFQIADEALEVVSEYVSLGKGEIGERFRDNGKLPFIVGEGLPNALFGSRVDPGSVSGGGGNQED